MEEWTVYINRVSSEGSGNQSTRYCVLRDELEGRHNKKLSGSVIKLSQESERIERGSKMKRKTSVCVGELTMENEREAIATAAVVGRKEVRGKLRYRELYIVRIECSTATGSVRVVRASDQTEEQVGTLTGYPLLERVAFRQCVFFWLFVRCCALTFGELVSGKDTVSGSL